MRVEVVSSLTEETLVAYEVELAGNEGSVHSSAGGQIVHIPSDSPLIILRLPVDKLHKASKDRPAPPEPAYTPEEAAVNFHRSEEQGTLFNEEEESKGK